MFARFLISVAGALLLAACAVPPVKPTAGQLRYERAAGAPVDAFKYHHNLSSWEPLTDRLLVVYTRPSEGYLLDLSPCPDLRSTSAIVLTSRHDEVHVRLDSVLTGGRAIPCTIVKIRPLDVAALKADRAG